MSAAERNHAAASSCLPTPASTLTAPEFLPRPRPRPRLNIDITRPCPTASDASPTPVPSRVAAPTLSVRSSAHSTTTDAATDATALSTGTLALGDASTADVFRDKRLDDGDGKTATGLAPTAASSAEAFRRNRRPQGDANEASGIASSASPILRFELDARGDATTHGSGTDASGADVFLHSRLDGGDVTRGATDARVGVDATPPPGSRGASWTGDGSSQEVLRRKRREPWQLLELATFCGSASRTATGSSIATAAFSTASAATDVIVAPPSARPYTTRTTCLGLM